MASENKSRELQQLHRIIYCGVGSRNKWSVVVVLLVLAMTMITSGFAQGGYGNPYRYRQRNVWRNPYKQYSNQFMPSLGSLIGGGSRIVETVKSRPLHYASTLGGPSYLSPAVPQSSFNYPGYNYISDRHRGYRQHPHSVSSTMYSAPPSYYQSSSPTVTTVTSSSSSPLSFGHPSSQPPPSPFYSPSYQSSRFPPVGPLASSSGNTETYREALDLFSEVVRKLEKETVPGFSGAVYNPPSYVQSSPVISNGIYGSSGNFPHHLDNIMGPDFMQRARKLYNKIMSEQQFKSLPPYYAPSTSSSRGPPPPSGLSYLESAMHPGGPSESGGNTYSFSGSSPYARNMVLDNKLNSQDSPLQRSLMDAVKSMEMSVGNNKNGFTPAENRDADNDADEMETSESRFVQQILAPQFPSPSPAAQDVSTSAPISPSSMPVMSSLNTIPLNDNDFIEHPLAFNEYEELIRDIAANHNY